MKSYNSEGSNMTDLIAGTTRDVMVVRMRGLGASPFVLDILILVMARGLLVAWLDSSWD